MDVGKNVTRKKYQAHCTQCGTPLRKSEIAYENTGSFVDSDYTQAYVVRETLCEFCAVNEFGSNWSGGEFNNYDPYENDYDE